LRTSRADAAAAVPTDVRISLTSALPQVPKARAVAAARATSVAFIGSGFAGASFASRIPQVRDRLELSPAQLGLVLLAIATGSLIALPLAGTLVEHLGSRRTVAVMALIGGAGLAVVAVGYLVGVVPVLVGLFLFGFSNGAWDVAMNVQGAGVERQLGRSIMPRFHAGFSVGTVAGAVVGAAMVALHVPVTPHLLAVGLTSAVVVPLAVRGFLPDADSAAAAEPVDAPAGGRASSALARWREPRTLVIGLIVLSFALAEGAGNDWIPVALIDGYGASAELGTLGFALFLAAMTGCRWFGPGLLDRHGRVAVLRVLTGAGVAGLAMFALGGSAPFAVAGIVFWGIGAALGFPVGMSAASDEPAAAAGRVSVVSSIGYCAFLAGPPVIGFVGEHVTVARALLLVAGLLALTFLLLGAVRPPVPRPGAASDPEPAGAAAEPEPRRT
jgi:predicted MFS family arabinose efflux permease